MKTKIIILTVLFFLPLLWGGQGWSQNVGINNTGNNPNASSILDLDASPGNNKGLLIPRVALSATNSNTPIGAGIATSLLVYNTATVISPPNSVIPGYYYWDATKWVSLSGGTGGNDWSLLGNAGTVDVTNFIGTTDNIPFNIRVNNQKAGRIDQAGPTFVGYQAGNSNTAINNTGIGYQALWSNTTGDYNTANGLEALYSNTTGSQNTATGRRVLYSNITGYQNTANGWGSLYSNTSGYTNTANAAGALYSNTTASQNTALGYQSLYNQSFNNGGVAWNSDNVAVGYQALYYNQPTGTWNGIQNTAVGNYALKANTTGNQNTANGMYALFLNTTGNNNTANGYQALYQNTGGYNTAVGSGALTWGSGSNNTATGWQSQNFSSGSYNTSNGSYALYVNAGGINNTAIGGNALYNNSTGSNNTASGYWALYYNTTGSSNTALGVSAGLGWGVNFNQCNFIGSNSSLSVARINVTMLGYGITNGQCTNDNQVLLGNTAVIDLRAAVTGITAYSDGRYKTNIKENVAGLDFILKLKPVTYNINPRELHKIWGTPDSLINKIDFSGAEKEIRIGFVAQDVEKAAKECGFIFPGIDVPKNDKEVYSLRYVDFIMPMVKGIQEQQNMIDELKKQNEKLQFQNTDMQKQIDELKILIKK